MSGKSFKPREERNRSKASTEKRHTLIVGVDGLVVLLHGMVGSSLASVTLGEVGFNTNTLISISESELGVSETQVGSRSVAVEDVVLGLVLDALGIPLNSFIELFLLQKLVAFVFALKSLGSTLIKISSTRHCV